MSDRNYISFSGDGSGVVYMKRGDEPSVLLFRADEPGMREYKLGDLKALAGQEISDVLKLSGVTRLRLVVDSIDAQFAREDAIDINHSHDCEVLVADLWAGQTYCGTIKGGSTGIRIVVARQHSHGRQTDWDLGNFADQGNAPTKGVKLNISTGNPTSVYVRVLTADRPTLENAAEQKYEVNTALRGWFYPVFNFVKDLLRFFRVKI